MVYGRRVGGEQTPRRLEDNEDLNVVLRSVLPPLFGVIALTGAIEEGKDVTLTEADRAYLKALETWLDMCPEMRTTE
jgi:hypothetical protein